MKSVIRIGIVLIACAALETIVWTSGGLATCKTGCMAGVCFKTNATCWKSDPTTAVVQYGTTLFQGDDTRGSVGGAQQVAPGTPTPTVTWKQVPECATECATDMSRCNNQYSMSTCAGTGTNPSTSTQYYCAGSGS
jgi:hypothetical protein